MSRTCYRCGNDVPSGTISCSRCGGSTTVLQRAPVDLQVDQSTKEETWGKEFSVDFECEGTIEKLGLKDQPFTVRATFEAGPETSEALLRDVLRKGDVKELERLLRRGRLTVFAERQLARTFDLSDEVSVFGVGALRVGSGLRFNHAAQAWQWKMSSPIYAKAGIKLGSLRIFTRRDLEGWNVVFAQSEAIHVGTGCRLAIAGISAAVTRATKTTEHTNKHESKPLAQPTPQGPRATSQRSPGSVLVPIGFCLVAAVLVAQWQNWPLPFISSYATAFVIAMGVLAAGLARIAILRRNAMTAWGIGLVCAGIFAGYFEWTLPLVQSFHIPLALGLLLIVVGAAPALLGVPCALVGGSMLVFAIYQVITAGLVAVSGSLWIMGLALLGAGLLLIRRHNKLQNRGGVFLA